jgi:cell division septation protein DedD
MAKSTKPLEPEYQLKHRLTGAVILVAIAVLVIPLLLSQSGIETSIDSNAASPVQKTFRSKIEPLNTSEREIIQNSQKEAGEQARPALLAAVIPGKSIKQPALQPEQKEKQVKPDNVSATGSKASSATKAPDKKSAEKKGDPEKSAKPKNIDKLEAIVKIPEQPALKQPATKKQAATKKQVATKKQAADTQTVAKSVPETSSTGWAVRVGTFSKQANVESVSTLLTNSGFKAKKTRVKTALGDATRIWLGPYDKKEIADKVSIRLKTLTGEKGFVTKHTS